MTNPAKLFDIAVHLNVVRFRPTAAQPTSLPELWKCCVREPRDADSWEALLFVLLPTIKRIAGKVAWRWGLSQPHDVADLTQEICLKLTRKCRELHAPESAPEFEAYLCTFFANAATDVLKEMHAKKRSIRLEVPLDKLDFELRIDRSPIGNTDAERQLWLKQVNDALPACDRDRTVFWLYYRQGFTAKEISQIPALDLTVKGVESMIHRLTQALKEKFGVVESIANERESR